MIESQPRSTRYVRAFGLLALMAGIVAMHALILGMSHGHTEHSAPAAMVMQQDHPNTSAPGCGGDCGSGHAGMHGCLFVLTGLLLGLGLTLLAWVGLRRRDAATAAVRRPRAHHARPPPWTVLSLADLAILRI
ncbi:hypothetical protein D7D52_01970 [Nocardia yunnanensis]|uniref:Uncharacterized protein n=1 Tax=Nocardia yunnanensis TaxID=2382165 RepID=A0A386Z5B2_9NOCA|nr:DUF6153 family protein [Nocardia yunnanensis]AYF72840.1 hypothetical protein D7D52_01970 [Nocardia yunnanensis]